MNCLFFRHGIAVEREEWEGAAEASHEQGDGPYPPVRQGLLALRVADAYSFEPADACPPNGCNSLNTASKKYHYSTPELEPSSPSARHRCTSRHLAAGWLHVVYQPRTAPQRHRRTAADRHLSRAFRSKEGRRVLIRSSEGRCDLGRTTRLVADSIPVTRWP